ncbi:MAG: anthranilate phosphoribosyltransferase [Thermodesulfobacteriota bacterium]
MIREAIAALVDGRSLTEMEMAGVMEEIMTGRASGAQIGALLIALRLKGETVEEITAAARVMREHALGIDVGAGEGIVVDTCGTGGDAKGTFNVSTTAAFVVAGCGVTVAKHGNRSVSSHCGSADVLEAMGVDLTLPPQAVADCIRTVGIGFMFAPMFHPAMKHAIGPRREIGIRTVFNLLGPLTNPAGANVQVMGVYDPAWTGKLARVLGRLGSRRALVVCGEGGMDELTLTGETLVSEWRDGAVHSWTVTPEEVGLQRVDIAEIRGAETAAASAEQLREVLAGVSGPRLDMVLLNGGAALLAAGRAQTLMDGIGLARRCIDSGAAMAKLEKLVAFCRERKAEPRSAGKP